MGKPDFIIAGFNRSGTSTLHGLLGKHPRIVMSEPKELHFFDRNANYAKGKDWYEAHFAGARADQKKGDATPSYILKGVMFEEGITSYRYQPKDDAVMRLAKTYPDMKLILSLRHPVANAKSHMERARIRGLEEARKTLEEAIGEELEEIRRLEETHLCYLYLTRFSLHIKHLLNYFPREQILFLQFENWTKHQQRTLDQVCDFIGLPHYALQPEDHVHLNTGVSFRSNLIGKLFRDVLHIGGIYSFFLRLGAKKGYDELAPEVFETLSALYVDEVAELQSLTGLDLSSWNIKGAASS